MIPSSGLPSIFAVSTLVSDRWWSRRPWLAVAAVAVAAMALHALFLGAPLAPDEGGYLLVARQWHGEGPLLYGNLWVDRPPLLLVAFAMAGRFGPLGIQVLACLCAGVVVVAAGWAGWAVAGNSAGRWSALTAGALSASALIGTQELDGELLAIPFVMLACSLVLHAWYRAQRGQYLLAGAAGVAATAAVLIKQNFIEAFVFAIVFLGANILSGVDRRRAVRMMATFSIGVAASGWLFVGWAIAEGRLGALWFATYTFRAEAAAVIRAGSWHAPGTRLIQLIGLAAVSGIVGLSVLAAFVHRAGLRRGDPLTWALAAGFGVEVGGIALGGNYWPHYLIGVIPMLSLAVGAAIARGPLCPTRVLRGLVLLAFATSVVAAPIAAANDRIYGNKADRLGEWLGHTADSRDTAVVTFTHPNVLEKSRLSSPYPYVWSLPMRTLDPHLTLLRKTLRGPQAPTWIVQWDAFDTWGLDANGELAKTVASHYRVVAHVCGHPVWLRDGVTRSVHAPRGCRSREE